jgi:hypothetical protein
MPIAPVPVLPVEYSLGQARPGVITAVGIVSIVVASLGLLAGLVAGLYAVGLTIASAVSTSVATIAPAPATAPTATLTMSPDADPEASSDELAPGPRGFVPAVRKTILNGLSRKHQFNDEKRKRAHELLAKGGQEIIAVANGSFSVVDIENDVTECAELPSAAGEAEGPIYFIVGAGKIELYDDHAVFFPSGHGQPIRVAKGVSIDEEDVEAAAASGRSTQGLLTPTQVQAVVNQAQSLSGGRMNAAQMAALTTELQNPAQQYIAVGRGASPPVRQVHTVNVQPDGTVQIFTRGGFLSVNPSGQVVSSSTFNSAAAFSRFRIRASASILTIIASALGLALSIYLLVVGILTMRQRPSSRRLHLIYAVLKIPLTVLAAVGWFLCIRDLTQSVSGMAAMTPGTTTPSTAASAAAGAAVFAIIFGLVGLAYPVALLIVMNTPNVRAYYRAEVAPR